MKFHEKINLTLLLVFTISTAVFCGEKPSNAIKKLNSTTDQVTVWKYKTGGKIYASPVIDNDVLYIGSMDKYFYAINIKSGKELWHFNSGEPILGSAAVFNNIVAFESGNILYGLGLNGSLVWTDTLYNVKTAAQHDEWDYFHSSPLLVDSIVYIGSEKGLLFGVNMNTGENVFRCQTPEAAFSVKTKPAVFNNSIYFGDWNGVFYSFSLTTGNMNWEYDTKKDNSYGSWVNAIQTDPVIYNNSVHFAGRSCNLYSLDAVTGKKNWMFHDPNSMWLLGGPAIDDSTIYIGSSNQHFIQAFNVYTGAYKWKRDVDYRIFGKPLVEGNELYFGTGNEVNDPFGSFYCLDKTTGVIKGRIPVGGQLHSSTLIKDSTMYFGCGDGYIYAVSPSRMESLTYADTYMKVFSSISVSISPDSVYEYPIMLYNRGSNSDSVVVTSSLSKYNSVSPSNFIIAPGDSQKVILTINAAGATRDRFNWYLTFTGFNSLKQFSAQKLVYVTLITTNVNEEKKIKSFNLMQNYPNPFNPSTTINYEIPYDGNVELKIFDIFGREVVSLVNGRQFAGLHNVEFNAAKLASGTYFYRIKAGGYTKTNKMLLLK